jgi:hypothetical protein
MAQPVDHADALVVGLDRDVDVQAADHRAAADLAELADDALVPRLRRDPRLVVVEHGQRRPDERRARLCGGRRSAPARVADLGLELGQRCAGPRGRLDLGPEKLFVNVLDAVGVRRGDRVGPLRQPNRRVRDRPQPAGLRVDEDQLLLDPDGAN